MTSKLLFTPVAVTAAILLSSSSPIHPAHVHSVSETYGITEARGVRPLDPRLSENTLRLDYIFSGNSRACQIALDELCSMRGWAGRRTHMKEVPLRGNGQILMTDAATGDTLYRSSFSTLFQEWQSTEEATQVTRSFENVFLAPMPAVPVNIQVDLYDTYGHISSSLTHPVDPKDILIRPKSHDVESRCIYRGGSSEDCIDVVIVAEGYTESEMKTFYADAETAAQAIFAHEPFGSFKDRFNITAVASPSEDSGVSVPREGKWKKTAAGSHFDTFYSDRYLTTLRLRQLHDLLSSVPYEHIIILANTATYGGGGIYNSYTLTTAHHRSFRPVVVHEFGHSFGGLADEYFYDDQYEQIYHPDIEPWEANITTKADFGSKWQNLVDSGRAGLVEGGGYMSHGVWRGEENCRMRTNAHPVFCNVCQQALEAMIRFYTED